MATESFQQSQGSPTVPMRVAVVGATGSGKTTLANALALRLGLTHVELDAFHHGPNWVETPDDIFRGLVERATGSEAWIVDGNYSKARDIIWARGNTVVWLDYSFPLVFWRLFRRTIRRGVLRQELWNGNREKLWWHFFTKKSLFLWLLKTYWRRQKEIPAMLARPEYGHLNVLRFKSPADADRWLRDVTGNTL